MPMLAILFQIEPEQFATILAEIFLVSIQIFNDYSIFFPS